MARAIAKGPFVFGDPATFGPIGGTFAPDTTSQATLYNSGAANNGLVLFVRLVNYLRQGFINANLATATGGVTAEAQVAGVYVRPLVTTGGTIEAALSAFTSTYVQAEWVALYTLVNTMRTLLSNAGLVTATSSVIPYTNPRHSKFVQQDYNIGGTVTPALTSPGASYTKSEIDKLVVAIEQLRFVMVQVGLASDSSQATIVNLTDGSDVALPKHYSKTLVMHGITGNAGLTATVKKGSVTNDNGLAITATLLAKSQDVFKTGVQNPDLGVVTVTTSDNVTFTITAKNEGIAQVTFYTANGAEESIMVTVVYASAPASLELDDDASTFDISDNTAPQQLGWVVKDAYGFTITAYTNDITYVTFASNNAHATVDVNGLVTKGTAGVAVITATFAQTFSTGADSNRNTVTLTDTFTATVQA